MNGKPEDEAHIIVIKWQLEEENGSPDPKPWEKIKIWGLEEMGRSFGGTDFQSVKRKDAKATLIINEDLSLYVGQGFSLANKPMTINYGVQLEVAPLEVAPLEVAPLEVAPLEVAPLEVAPLEVAPLEVAPQRCCCTQIITYLFFSNKDNAYSRSTAHKLTFLG